MADTVTRDAPSCRRSSQRVIEPKIASSPRMSSLPSTTISIVCVYNNLAIRQECLDRTVRKYIDSGNFGALVEYIPVDNIHATYPSAGSALNYGASIAKNDIIVFVHQDVLLHSVEAVIEAASCMDQEHFGVLGAIGVQSSGRIVGSIRDRTVLLGDPVTQPTDVDSVDELLFMVPRSLIISEPLAESPDLAWHAYAVEYGLRVRRRGLRVGVAHIPVTHNSLTSNLARLDAAHATVAAQYREMLPVHTTCGILAKRTINGPRRVRLASQRSGYRWLSNSLRVREVYRHTATPVIFSDVRFTIDEIAGRSPGRELYILNHARGGRFADDDGEFIELKRRGNVIAATAKEISELSEVLDRRPKDSWLLITNMTSRDVRAVDSDFVLENRVIGYDPSIEYWMILGAELSDLPTGWYKGPSIRPGAGAAPRVNSRWWDRIRWRRRAVMKPVQRELRYGSWEFVAASNWARHQSPTLRISALIRSMARDPGLIRVFLAVLRLPVVEFRVRRADISLSKSYFTPSGHGRLARAVLDLPADEQRYLVGRARQTLRTNLRHARDLGVTSDRVSYEAWVEAAAAVLGSRSSSDPLGEQCKPGRHRAYYVARDADGTALAFAGADLFGQFAGLFIMLSRRGHPGASWARYQLHTFLALDLSSSGVRYLLAGSALREPTGHQYFQHLLGYRVCNLRVEVIPT